MKRVPFGKVLTVGKIREYFAGKTALILPTHHCGHFCIHFGMGQRQRQTDETPYWRTLKADGELNAKYRAARRPNVRVWRQRGTPSSGGAARISAIMCRIMRTRCLSWNRKSACAPNGAQGVCFLRFLAAAVSHHTHADDTAYVQQAGGVSVPTLRRCPASYRHNPAGFVRHVVDIQPALLVTSVMAARMPGYCGVPRRCGCRRTRHGDEGKFTLFLMLRSADNPQLIRGHHGTIVSLSVWRRQVRDAHAPSAESSASLGKSHT